MLSTQPPPVAPPRRRTSASQVVGEALLTFGVLLLLFAFYEAFWTNLASAKLQNNAENSLEQQWVNPRTASTRELGEAFARMYIPAFGSDYQFAIIEGVDEQDLLAGPGRYPDTQLPGEPGNFAVAGHRVGKGAPFNDLGALRACDAIVVETQTQWVTYRVLPMATDAGTRSAEASGCLPGDIAQRVIGGDYSQVQGRHITLPNDVSVLNPVPGTATVAVAPGAVGILTLTTCHPQFSNAERMIIHAVQTEATDKAAGIPAAMTEVS
ncbi:MULTISPECIES: class E sortase [Corynebacterium]|uniref:Class E sortase n=1 Tax=Corynebacterium sanguinis TaxID=2594913 RepID=A0A6C1TVW1_9CORY|nr:MULTISPECIES: class E sortase [Corynebacterium]MCT1426398.1 class E sortase [Corynebacterium sanguinis]MCT1463158.1 class E sortase [Corynebacterium sanguinis]MCT1498696.1 class E sortase [Corynebacterium sanguinis]MCT1598031.1 class E sortase [Corynebacterium sanguinis]MCT1629090.1 class E sortase [Corynebacterium sanguinis]